MPKSWNILKHYAIQGEWLCSDKSWQKWFKSNAASKSHLCIAQASSHLATQSVGFPMSLNSSPKDFMPRQCDSDVQWHILTHSDTQWHTVTHSDTQWHTVIHSDTQWHNWCISSAGLNYTPLQWFSFRPNRWHITSAEFAYAKFMCIMLLALQPTRSSHLLCCTLVAVQLACVSNACFLSTEIPFCLSIFLIYIYTHVCVCIIYIIYTNKHNTGMSWYVYVFLLCLSYIMSFYPFFEAAKHCCQATLHPWLSKRGRTWVLNRKMPSI